MPKSSRVHHVKEAIQRENPKMPEGRAIAIAQGTTHQSYATGKPLPSKPAPKGGKR